MRQSSKRSKPVVRKRSLKMSQRHRRRPRSQRPRSRRPRSHMSDVSSMMSSPSSSIRSSFSSRDIESPYSIGIRESAELDGKKMKRLRSRSKRR